MYYFVGELQTIIEATAMFKRNLPDADLKRIAAQERYIYVYIHINI
jgi:hypothetical protein